MCQDTSEQPTQMGICQLPAEMQVSVLKYLNTNEIDTTKRVCWTFNRLIKNNSTRLARHNYTAKIDQTNQIHIETTSDNKHSSKTFQMVEDRDQLVECLKHVQITDLTINGPVEEDVIDSLVNILNKTRQYEIHSFIIQSVTIECELKCSRLFQLLASGNCQSISLVNCKLACGFTKEQSQRLDDLCQFTVKNCKPTNGLGILGKYLSKLAFDMRYKPRCSLPFYAEAPSLKVSEICEFIKTWIGIWEAPFFQIYVNNCETEFKNEFLRECAINELYHHQLEFKSKAHPMAHIKAVFDDRQRRLQIYPIVDVPARIDRSFCTARQFRDF